MSLKQDFMKRIFLQEHHNIHCIFGAYFIFAHIWALVQFNWEVLYCEISMLLHIFGIYLGSYIFGVIFGVRVKLNITL